MKKAIGLIMFAGAVLTSFGASADDSTVHQCITVLKNSVSACTPKDQQQGRCDQGNNKIACMSYENRCYEPVKCTMKGNAQLEEPYTGFTKDVSDWREETVFYNSNHRICFNFAKDEYHAWKLKKVGKPELDCEMPSSGREPCRPGTPGCDGTMPTPDPRECDPFDWDSNC